MKNLEFVTSYGDGTYIYTTFMYQALGEEPEIGFETNGDYDEDEWYIKVESTTLN